MNEELIDDHILEEPVTSKRYAVAALIIGLVAVFCLLVFVTNSLQPVSLEESHSINWVDGITVLIFVLSCPIGLLMSYLSKRRKENAPRLWMAGFIINLIGVLFDIPAMYFIVQGFNTPY